MRGSCIKCPDPPPPVRLAIGLVILVFNLLVMLGPPTLIGTVMDIVGDLQMFRGIGMMAVVTNQEIQAFYNQLALLTLDFSYERSQPSQLVCDCLSAHSSFCRWLAFDVANRFWPHSLWAAGVQRSRLRLHLRDPAQLYAPRHRPPAVHYLSGPSDDLLWHRPRRQGGAEPTQHRTRPRGRAGPSWKVASARKAPLSIPSLFAKCQTQGGVQVVSQSTGSVLPLTGAYLR
jgi:hypothetical protein